MATPNEEETTNVVVTEPKNTPSKKKEQVVEAVADNSSVYKKLAKYHEQWIIVKKNAVNKFFNNTYATLDAINEAITKPLAEVWLILFHKKIIINKWSQWCLLTTLVDVDNPKSTISTFSPIQVAVKVQELWSLITYMRRYNIGELLNISTETDDDGNAASGAEAKKTPASTTKPADDFDAPAPVKSVAAKSTPVSKPKTSESVSATAPAAPAPVKEEPKVVDVETTPTVAWIVEDIAAPAPAATPAGTSVDPTQMLKDAIDSSKDRNEAIGHIKRIKAELWLWWSTDDPHMKAGRTYLDSKFPS